MSKLKALIIGSKGNVGSVLVNFLKNNNYEVFESDIKPAYQKNYLMADINFPLDLLPAFEWKPDVVFLLSSIVSRVTCEQAASLSVGTNLSGINNVIQLTKKANAKLVFFSTSEVYGDKSVVLDENSLDPSPNNRYGLTKLMAEKLVKYEVDHCGLKAVILRPFMIYDENEDLGDHRSAMIRFTENLIQSKNIIVHKGSNRGWLHVQDAVRAIEAASKLDHFDIINIGNDDFTPILTLAEMICDEVGANRDLIKEESLPSQMTLIKKPNLNKMYNKLGIKDLIPLREGVKRVCNVVNQKLKNV